MSSPVLAASAHNSYTEIEMCVRGGAYCEQVDVDTDTTLLSAGPRRATQGQVWYVGGGKRSSDRNWRGVRRLENKKERKKLGEMLFCYWRWLQERKIKECALSCLLRTTYTNQAEVFFLSRDYECKKIYHDSENFSKDQRPYSGPDRPSVLFTGWKKICFIVQYGQLVFDKISEKTHE